MKVLIAIVAILTTAVHAADRNPTDTFGKPLPISAEQAKALTEVGRRGERLFRFDRAAWITTDSMLASLPKDQLNGVRGWIVEPRGSDSNLDVTYFRLDGSTPYAVYVANTVEAKVASQRIVEAGKNEPLDQDGQRMVSALLAARRVPHVPCTQAPFNSVVLPPEADGSVTVYLLTAPTEAGMAPMGGHFRLVYDAGNTLVSDRAFSKACLNMRASAAGKDKGEMIKPAMLFVTHLLDPLPTEIHSFTSFSQRLPLLVGTSDGLWGVTGSHFEHFSGPDQP